MSDEEDKPVNPFGLAMKLTIDDSKIYILRKKADGKTYRIHGDGREELEPEAKES
jgi:hypothetical protein